MATTRFSDLGNLALAGSDEIFNKAAGRPRKLEWKEITRVKQVEAQVGHYDSMGDIGPAQLHSEEDAIPFDKIEYNNRTSITSYVYAKGVKVTLEASIFDLYNQIQRVFGDPLIDVMNNKKEDIVAAAYNGVFAATGADGVYLASASHPLKNSVNLNDNLASGALGVDSLTDAKNKFNFIYTQAGEPFVTEPTHLLIHPTKLYQALQILNSNLIAMELSNTKNTIQDVMPIKVLTNRRITYSSGVCPWFLLDKTLTDAGCVLQTKKGLTLETWFEKEDLSLKGLAYEVYGCGFVAPGYGFIASPGS